MNLGSSTVHAINSPHLGESKIVSDPRRGFWIPGTGFRTMIFYQLNFNSGFQSHLSGIPYSLSCIQDCKAHDFAFHNQKFPGFRNLDSLTLGDINRCKLALNYIVFSPYDYITPC